MTIKNPNYLFKAIPKPSALDGEIDLVSLWKSAMFDGTYVYGWYVDGFIVGEVIEANEEYIAIEYWIPVEPESVCIVGEIKMPRYNVERNGKWACFSTVIDDFITPFMSRRRYDRWRRKEYGRDRHESGGLSDG